MLQHFLKWPNRDEYLFALRGIAAAALALWVALAAGLPRPFWAPMATTILSLPGAAGSIFVRSVSRFVGTCMGVLAATFILIPFVNYTVLLCVLTGAWIAFCVYFLMINRTTSAYTFTVAGWTVPVIVTSVLSDMKFINVSYMMEIAVYRAIETCIGFVCAVICHSLIFPNKIGPNMVNQLDGIGNNIREWTVNILMGKSEKEHKNGLSAVQLLSSLRVLSANLPFDVTNERWVINGIRLLQDRLTTMIPVVSSIDENLSSLRAKGGINEKWQLFLREFSEWIQNKDYSTQSADIMRRRLKAMAPEINGSSSWNEALLVRLIIDLDKLVSACEGCKTRREAIADALEGKWEKMPKKMATPLSVLHKDHANALFMAAAGGISISLIMMIWVVSGWGAGFVAPTMASIFFCTFATGDNPVKVLKTILTFTIIGLPAAYFYVLIVMFSTHSYEMLLMCFIPALFILGIFISRPPIRLGSTIFMMGIWSTTTMYDLDMANMTSFMNGQVFAQCGGIVLCMLCAMILRAFDYSWTTGRLLKNIHKDISRLAKSEKAPSFLQTVIKMVDRVNMIAPRLNVPDESHSMTLPQLMRQMRLGINMAKLRTMQSRLARNGIDIKVFLADVSSYFDRHETDGVLKQKLLSDIDRLISAVCMMESTVRKNAAVAALSGIRADFFPDALPYNPQPMRPLEAV